jgi:hypothetical protein
MSTCNCNHSHHYFSLNACHIISRNEQRPASTISEHSHLSRYDRKCAARFIYQAKEANQV